MNIFDDEGKSPYSAAFWGLDDPTGLVALSKSMGTMRTYDAIKHLYSIPLSATGNNISNFIDERYSSMMGTNNISEHIDSMIGTPAISARLKAAMGNVFNPRLTEAFKSAQLFPMIEKVGSEPFRNLAIPTVGANEAWKRLAETMFPLARSNMASRLEELSPSILGSTSRLIDTAAVFGAQSFQDFVGFVQASPEAQEIAERADEDPELRRELEAMARTANFTGFITSPTAQGTVVLIAIVLMIVVSYCSGPVSVPATLAIGEGGRKITATQRKKHQQLIDGGDGDLEGDE
ncbi:hypothetical protein [Corynebacterium kalidii]